MSISEEKKQKYLDLISDIIENADAAGDEYKKVSRSASTLCDVNQAVNYNPNMSVVRNNGGIVIGYDYKYTGPTKPNTDALDVNSNNDTGLYGEVDAITGAAPHVKPPTTTRVSGGIVNDVLDKVGQFTSGLIDTSWAVVSALSKFGKNVAGTAADVIQATGALMGDTFDNLLTRSTETGANAIRALFGVDSNGSTTMYIDEDTLGALAIVLRDKGFFSHGETDIVGPPSGAGSYYSQVVYPFEYSTMVANTVNPFKNSGISWASGYDYAFNVIFRCQGQDMSYYVLCNTPGLEIYFYSVGNYLGLASLTQFYGGDFRVIKVLDSNPTVPYNWTTFTPNNSTLQTDPAGNTGYIVWSHSFGSAHILNVEAITTSSARWNPGWPMAMLFGVSEGQTPISGVSDQSGATDVSDAIVGNDPHIVSNELFNNYSQVMGEPLLVNVMDDSCNQVTNRYFSVPISYSPTNLNVSAPITGTVQLDPSFNPNISLDPSINLDKLIDQIVLQLQGSNAGEDVVIIIDDPDDPSEPTDDGGVQTLPTEIPNTGIGVTPETELPQTSVQGMWHVYNPSSAEVSALGSWLWSTSIIEQIARMFNDPTNSIIGLHAIYGEPHVSSSASIVVGNLTSTVSARVVSSQYTQVDCGTVWFTEFFGNVFDYAPYTEVSLFLPFIGIVPLDVADVMRAEIGVIYNVDVYTGACVAQVSVNRDGVGGVVYQYAGSCAISYPVSAVSYNHIFSSMVSEALAVAGLASGAGGLVGAGLIAGGFSGAVNSRIAHVSRSGAFSGNAGALGCKKPYLIVRRPQTNLALNFERYDGRGSNFTSQLSQCSGYTKCKEMHLVIPNAYKSELDELEQLLHQGIIL